MTPRQLDIPVYRRIGRKPGMGCSALAQVLGIIVFPVLCKYVVPAAKRVTAKFLESAVPEFAGVVSGRNSFKTVAQSVGSQTLRKQLDSGSRKQELTWMGTTGGQ